MRLTFKGASALLAVALLSGGGIWLSQPEPLEVCLDKVVANDQASAADQPLLVAMGEAAELKGQHAVEFSRDQFFSCTRYKALATEWPSPDLAKAAYRMLKNAPSFEYGRYRVLTKKDAPGLKDDELVMSARLLRAAGAQAEARKQLQACENLSKDTAAATDFAQLSEPYLTAIVWNMGLATSPAEARSNAQQLAVLSFEQAETPACDEKRFANELATLRLFKDGHLPGLPCRVEPVDGEPELKCE